MAPGGFNLHDVGGQVPGQGAVAYVLSQRCRDRLAPGPLFRAATFVSPVSGSGAARIIRLCSGAAAAGGVLGLACVGRGAGAVGGQGAPEPDGESAEEAAAMGHQAYVTTGKVRVSVAGSPIAPCSHAIQIAPRAVRIGPAAVRRRFGWKWPAPPGTTVRPRANRPARGFVMMG